MHRVPLFLPDARKILLATKCCQDTSVRRHDVPKQDVGRETGTPEEILTDIRSRNDNVYTPRTYVVVVHGNVKLSIVKTKASRTGTVKATKSL